MLNEKNIYLFCIHPFDENYNRQILKTFTNAETD